MCLEAGTSECFTSIVLWYIYYHLHVLLFYYFYFNIYFNNLWKILPINVYFSSLFILSWIFNFWSKTRSPFVISSSTFPGYSVDESYFQNKCLTRPKESIYFPHSFICLFVGFILITLRGISFTPSSATARAPLKLPGWHFQAIVGVQWVNLCLLDIFPQHSDSDTPVSGTRPYAFNHCIK